MRSTSIEPVRSVLPPFYALRLFWKECIVGLTGCHDEQTVPFLAAAEADLTSCVMSESVRRYLSTNYVYRIHWAEAVLTMPRCARWRKEILMDHAPTAGMPTNCWGWAFQTAAECEACDESRTPPWERLSRGAERERLLGSMSAICSTAAFDGDLFNVTRGWGVDVPEDVRRWVETRLQQLRECEDDESILDRGNAQLVVQLTGDEDAGEHWYDRKWITLTPAVRQTMAAHCERIALSVAANAAAQSALGAALGAAKQAARRAAFATSDAAEAQRVDTLQREAAAACALLSYTASKAEAEGAAVERAAREEVQRLRLILAEVSKRRVEAEEAARKQAEAASKQAEAAAVQLGLARRSQARVAAQEEVGRIRTALLAIMTAAEQRQEAESSLRNLARSSEVNAALVEVRRIRTSLAAIGEGVEAAEAIEAKELALQGAVWGGEGGVTEESLCAPVVAATENLIALSGNAEDELKEVAAIIAAKQALGALVYSESAAEGVRTPMELELKRIEEELAIIAVAMRPQDEMTPMGRPREHPMMTVMQIRKHLKAHSKTKAAAGDDAKAEVVRLRAALHALRDAKVGDYLDLPQAREEVALLREGLSRLSEAQRSGRDKARDEVRRIRGQLVDLSAAHAEAGRQARANVIRIRETLTLLIAKQDSAKDEAKVAVIDIRATLRRLKEAQEAQVRSEAAEAALGRLLYRADGAAMPREEQAAP